MFVKGIWNSQERPDVKNERGNCVSSNKDFTFIVSLSLEYIEQ
jgi:hypothetical protein